MTLRRALRLSLLSALLLTVGAVPAGAAPRVTSVDGIVYTQGKRTGDYVVFDVRTKGATRVRMNWGRRGGAHPRVRRGRVGIGYARRDARKYRVSVRACKRKRCGRVRRFSGRFRPVDTSTEPPPNSEPQSTPPPLFQIVGQLPTILPTLENITGLTGVPLPSPTGDLLPKR